MAFKSKIQLAEITYGPNTPDVDPLVVEIYANRLMSMGYRRTSNAYCIVTRIDREDWLDVLATKMNCARADFYDKNGSGVGDRWRDHYCRMYSRDKLTIHPDIVRKVAPY